MLNHKTITQCNLLLVSVFHDVFKRSLHLQYESNIWKNAVIFPVPKSQISKRVQMGRVHISHDKSPEKLMKSEILRKTEAVGDEEDVTVTQFSSAYPIQGQRKGWSLPQL